MDYLNKYNLCRCHCCIACTFSTKKADAAHVDPCRFHPTAPIQFHFLLPGDEFHLFHVIPPGQVRQDTCCFALPRTAPTPDPTQVTLAQAACNTTLRFSAHPKPRACRVQYPENASRYKIVLLFRSTSC